MKLLLNKRLIAASVFTLATLNTLAQVQISGTDLAGRQNAVTTAVPFLQISPDARAAGMGDIGVATSPDANSIHWNIGKLAFIGLDKRNRIIDGKNSGVSLSYTPWLRQLVPDVSLSYLSFYSRLNEVSAVSFSLRRFSFGQINFTDVNGSSLGSFNPSETAIDGGYSTRLSDKFSIGVALRYINSNLTGGRGVSGTPTKAGNSLAGDVGVFYKSKKEISGDDVFYTIGASISNLGSKISYLGTNEDADFIPTNLRVGTAWTFDLDEYNKLTLSLDLNKLLVPTPPVYDTALDQNGKQVIAFGQRSDVTVLQGVFQSFTDAPGGAKEEFREIIWNAGAEYWYQDQFAVRTGYFHEAATKGNRKYATVGVGIKYNVLTFDAAYLIPFQQRHPLQNTFRYTLTFDLNAFKSDKNQ